MKILFVSVLVAMILGCTATPKHPEIVTTDTTTNASVPASDSAGIIHHIKEVYANINKEKLTQKSFAWEANTTCEAPPMGGALTYFYRGNEIVKMLSVGGEDHGAWKEEYYFDNNQLVLVHQNNSYGGAANPDEVSYQNRYYFANNQLVKKIESDPGVELDPDAILDMVQTTYRLKDAGNSAAIARIFSCHPE